VDAINDHLLRLERIVSASLQEAPVCHIARARRGDVKVNNWESVEVGQRVWMGTNVSVWSSFGMLLSEKAGSFCSSSRRTSNGWYTVQRLEASKASESMIEECAQKRHWEIVWEVWCGVVWKVARDYKVVHGQVWAPPYPAVSGRLK
jgi:hypothetical protein